MKEKNINRNDTRAKGYRLKPETHEMVEVLRRKINSTNDEVISRACRMFGNSINRTQNKNKNK